MHNAFFFTAFHQIILLPYHVPGKLNTAADHLSRDALSAFLQLVPGAMPLPKPLPEELMAGDNRIGPQRTGEPCYVLLYARSSCFIPKDLQIWREPLPPLLSIVRCSSIASIGSEFMQVCVLFSRRKSHSSYYKNIFVGGSLPSDKVGFARSVSRLTYASAGLHNEGCEEGAGERGR